MSLLTLHHAGGDGRGRDLLLILSGATAFFLGTANPLLHLPLIAILYPASLYILGLRGANPFRLGWLTGLLGASGGLYWISVAVHDYGGFPWPPAVACAVLLGAYIGLWGGFFARLVALARILPPWRRCLAALLRWFLLEWTRGWFLTGFPWLTLASGQAAWPVLIQGASLCGDYFLSAVYAGIGVLLAQAWLAGEEKNGSHWPFAAAAALALVLILGFGAWRVWSWQEQGQPLRLTLVQGNMRQDVKWDAAFQQATVDKYLDLSRRALAEQHPGRPDALVWPETAMPFYFQSNAEQGSRLEAFARESGVSLIFGAPGYFRPPPTAGRPGEALIYNRAFFLDKGGALAGEYDKRHLVPFGEFVPPGFNLKIFAAMMRSVGGFTPGRAVPPFELPVGDGDGGVRLGMLICYEAIFPEIARERAAQGAQVLINISNDAWYNKSSAPVQHLYLSLLRAVEQGRWLARGTNTGVTAFVDPLGRIYPLGGVGDQSGLFVDGSLSREITALSGHSVFFHLQPRLPALAIALVLIIVWSPASRRLSRAWRERGPGGTE